MPRKKTAVDLQTEEYVASLFRVLGYTVQQDVLLHGHQIDVVARKTVPGLGPVCIAIEVKHHASGSVPKSEVVAFTTVAQHLLGIGACTKATIVSNAPFTRFGKEVSKSDSRIEARTLRELERDLLNVENGLIRWLEEHRRQPINRRYVDLELKRVAQYPRENKSQPASLTGENLLDAAEADPESAILIFADYGAGKSTTLLHLKATAAEAYLKGTSDRIPLFMSLKDLGSEGATTRFIHETLLREFGVDMPIELFWKLNDAGRLIILQDGFDEITLRANAQKRVALLGALSPMLFGPSPAFLTSRPGYFVRPEEYEWALADVMKGAGLQYGADKRAVGRPSTSSTDRRMRQVSDGMLQKYLPPEVERLREPRFSRYQLLLLDTERIDRYLDKCATELAAANTTPKQVRRFLDTVYDLSDLMSRPIILDMIVETISRGAIDLSQETVAFGPSNLYELYAGLKLEIDWTRSESRREVLEPDERRKFAELAALQMLETDELLLEGEAVESLALQASSIATTLQIEDIITDLRTCSFLTVNDDGSLRFIHKSFQEFFAARAIKSEMDAGSTRRLRNPLPTEVLYFLGGFGFADNDFFQILTERSRSVAGESALRRSERDPLQIESGNIAKALLFARESLRHARWFGVRTGSISRKELRVQDALLEQCRFEDMGIEKFRLERTEVSSSYFNMTGASLVEVSQGRGDLHVAGNVAMVVIDDSSAELIVDSGCEQVELVGSSGSLKTAAASYTTITAADSDLRFLGAGSLDVDLKRVRFDLRAAPAQGQMVGTIEHSFVQIPALTWRRMGFEVKDSVLLISADMEAELLGKPSTRADASPVVGSLILSDPSVEFDRTLTDTTLILGGISNEPPSLGFCFTRERANRPDPESGLAGAGAAGAGERGRASPGRSTLRVIEVGSAAFAITGSGDEFEAARAAFRDVLREPLMTASTFKRDLEEFFHSLPTLPDSGAEILHLATSTMAEVIQSVPAAPRPSGPR